MHASRRQHCYHMHRAVALMVVMMMMMFPPYSASWSAAALCASMVPTEFHAHAWRARDSTRFHTSAVLISIVGFLPAHRVSNRAARVSGEHPTLPRCFFVRTWNVLMVVDMMRLLLLCLVGLCAAAASAPTFTIEDDRFIKDGKPFQILSGRWVCVSVTMCMPAPC